MRSRNGWWRGQRGQSLLEVALAMGIAVVIIGALVTLGIGALRGARYAQNKSQAAKLANEGMEMARRERDRASSWEAFLSYAVDEEVGDFTRTVAVAEIESDVKSEVTVTVSWTDSAGVHPVTLVGLLTNWR